jgi:DNA-binding response OmpR family regulator
VDDEPALAELVADYLSRDGFEVERARDGEEALRRARTLDPDVVVLDLGLPGIDGLEVCRQLRTFSDCYVVMLTARADEVDTLVGLSVGADDYVTKPFSPRELVARVKAVLRRTGAGAAQDGAGDSLRFGDLSISRSKRTVEDQRGAINLTAREFDLLFYLASHPGQVFSRERLMDAVWDYDFAGDPSTVTVHVRRLRAKLEADPSRPRYLKTVWGAGYKFEP